MPLVSVVMSSYNYEKYIASAIESVLAQTHSDLELIIVDDASKDGSRELIRSYSKRDDRVKAIFHDSNMGISRTVNEGWNAASGKFIASISSDDLWAENKLERQLEILRENEDLVVWTEGEIIDGCGRATGELFTEVHNASERRKSGNIFEELLKGNFIFASSRIFKRSNLMGRRYSEDMKYLSDYQFAVDMASAYDYYFIMEPLTKYRMHGNNTANRDMQGYRVDIVKLVDYFLSTHGDRIYNDLRVDLHRQSVNILKGQLAQVVQENDDIKSSLIWQALMAYQKNIVERCLPVGTGRRYAYDHFIKSSRKILEV